MMPADVGPAAAGPGMAAIHTRIAAIQARLDSMVPGAGSAFQLPGTQAPTPTDGRGAAVPIAPNGTLGTPAPAPAPATTAAAPSAAGAGPTTAASGVGAVDPSRLPEAARAWLPSIERAATEAGIDPALFTALVQHESNFRQQTVSHAGAIGLAQLMPGTAEWLGVDPHDPEANLDGGARYLKEQLDRFGQVDLALAAYNAGPNRVTQAGGIPRITETQLYVERVMSTWEQLR